MKAYTETVTCPRTYRGRTAQEETQPAFWAQLGPKRADRGLTEEELLFLQVFKCLGWGCPSGEGNGSCLGEAEHVGNLLPRKEDVQVQGQDVPRRGLAQVLSK